MVSICLAHRYPQIKGISKDQKGHLGFSEELWSSRLSDLGLRCFSAVRAIVYQVAYANWLFKVNYNPGNVSGWGQIVSGSNQLEFSGFSRTSLLRSDSDTFGSRPQRLGSTIRIITENASVYYPNLLIYIHLRHQSKLYFVKEPLVIVL